MKTTLRATLFTTEDPYHRSPITLTYDTDWDFPVQVGGFVSAGLQRFQVRKIIYVLEIRTRLLLLGAFDVNKAALEQLMTEGWVREKVD